jgi:hypothetical protein
MARTVAVIMGAVFLLIGLAGFVVPNMLGAHLSWVHNLIHLGSGAASLYLGFRGSLSAAKLFGLVFGVFYLLLGVVGYWLGMHRTTDLPAHVAEGYNQHMFRVIPGYLELGSMDHLIHVAIGAIYIIGALMTRRSMAKYLENDPMAQP